MIIECASPIGRLVEHLGDICREDIGIARDRLHIAPDEALLSITRMGDHLRYRDDIAPEVDGCLCSLLGLVPDREGHRGGDIAEVCGIFLYKVCIVGSRAGSHTEIWCYVAPRQVQSEREEKRQNECIFDEVLDFGVENHSIRGGVRKGMRHKV
jgi:hypothetical protein